MVVAAMGSFAGSLAGGAAMKALGVGQQIEAKPAENPVLGVASAQLKKAGKSTPGLSVAQADPQQSMEYFRNAASVSQGYYKKGLSMYESSMAAAAKEIQINNARANATLYPVQQAGLAALNKELQWMGLAPISQSAGLSQVAGAMGSYPELQKQLREAEKITDPSARAAMKTKILQSIQGSKKEMLTMDEPRPELYQSDLLNGLSKATSKNTNLTAGERAAINGKSSRQGLADKRAAEQAKIKASQDAQAAWDQKQEELMAQNAQLTIDNYNLDDLYNQFDSTYGEEAAKRLTPQEIQAELEQTPGYQFQMSQGLQALDRSASAKGNLNSGNAQTAAVKYGQGLADQTFQQSLANLASIATQGLPSNAQVASNQVAQGQSNASLLSTVGAATANTYNAIGNQYAASYTNMGNTFMTAAMFNASEQNKALSQDRAEKAQKQMAAMGAAAPIMNAQTAQNQFQYDVFRGQQGGQAFYGGGGGGYNILPVGGSGYGGLKI